jgi:hypothetical protein
VTAVRTRPVSGETVLDRRVARTDWSRVANDLDASGFAVLPRLLNASHAKALIKLWDVDASFRKRIQMDRHDFGQGEYGYFAEPLPGVVGLLRERLYSGLAPIAAAMGSRLGRAADYPSTLAAYTRRCARHGQIKPTPLLLHYETGGYNRLHRDLYGDLAFPLQVTVLLSRPYEDFDGGEFLLVENRARRQARGETVPLNRGDAVVFPVNERPVAGKHGDRRAELRHGIATVRRGERWALGIIFHNAR